LRRLVALKFVRPDRLDTRSLERFEREARAGGRLSHPAIVRTLAFDGSSDPAWIAQELVEGSWTLKDFLDELRTEDKTPTGYYRKAAELVATLADGLESAHQAGVIHRDIKPQNILIGPDDAPKLTDFGLARVSDDSFVSVTGDFAGTYYYMSPEQVTAKRVGLDQRTDIFSLGVVLYELLSLRRPFEGDTTHQISQKILWFDPPQPSKIRSQCPRELSVISGKALEKDPDRRFQSMAEFAADLRRHLANQPIHARSPGALLRSLKWARRNPALSSAATVGLLALVLISGLLFEQVRTANRLAQTNAALQTANLALAGSNAELAAQTQRAENGESAARANAAAASAARDEATRKANDVLALSAQKEHDDLVAEAVQLWPAHPQMLPRYDRWLRRAKELLDGRPADETTGQKSRPSLSAQRAKLAELRRSALPLTAKEQAADRESHPRYLELQAKEAELLWFSRMLGAEAWPAEASVEFGFGEEPLPQQADTLNALAWSLVDPAQPINGQELRALALARSALTAASPEQSHSIRVTLAWALYRVGRFEEALAEAQAALATHGGPTIEKFAADLLAAIDRWRGDDHSQLRSAREALANEVAALREVLRERRTYRFEDPEQEWWHRQLTGLVADLEALGDPTTGLAQDVTAEPFGWGVAKRLRFAATIAERSVSGPDAQRCWVEAIASIQASPLYSSLLIEPQMGLLPIGMDPQSQLFEFAHLQTGEPAHRGADGRLLLTEETGLVFVLIPGGRFWMGAQGTDPSGRNYDPQAQQDEGPVHEVELRAYFLSKYELTQGQWQRIAATNPSFYRPPHPGVASLLHPVEQVDWMMCVELLDALGLTLPSEAQWEYALRGGTTTAWWTGQVQESLRGKVNIADRSAQRMGATWPALAEWPDHDDGSAVHSVVGSYPANAFGLHEMAGNVFEWCLDRYESGFYGQAIGPDPVAESTTATNCANRGGSFSGGAAQVRSADRSRDAPEDRDPNLGLRPARALE
jgi:formylglycine-generating enzyme required for sulfatase activity